MIFKKILTIFMIFLLIGINLFPLINSKIIEPKNRTIIKVNSIKSVNYINASSSYDYGWKVGIQFRLQYKLFSFILELIKRDEINHNYIEYQINIIKQFYPSFLKELEGLSDSTGITLERLIAARILFSELFGGACTVTASTGVATKNNETYITQNYDTNFEYESSFRYKLFKIILIPIVRAYTWLWNRFINIARPGPQYYKYVFIGTPIISEITLLNEKGLGYGGTATRLTNNNSRYIDEGPGILPYLLNRIAMRTCENVSEVANLFKNSERCADKNKKWPHDYDYDTSLWCDKNGSILAIEQTHSYIKIVYGNSTEITGAPEGILWHANHHLWLDANKTGSIYPGEEGVNNNSFYRGARARELLELNYGNITLDVCKNITRDHDKGSNENGKDSRDICRHPDKDDFSMTYFSWIVLPKKMTVYWTYGSPCNRKFVERDFSKIFKD